MIRSKYVDEIRNVNFIPADHKGFDAMIGDDDDNSPFAGDRFFGGRYDARCSWHEEQDVGSGAWVFIAHAPLVGPGNAVPKRYHIYWAVPVQTPLTIEYFDRDESKRIRMSGECIGRDKFLRQAVRVLTTEEVVIFTDEYTLVPEDRLKEYIEMGYEMVPIQINADEPLDIALVERGRVLVEEEREIIWALMLDGLSEGAACSEYFYGKHIDTTNRSMYYRPNKELYEAIVDYFGP